MLEQVFKNHNDRFTGKWSHYFDVYDRHLGRFIGKKFNLLEIGISNGGSLQVWKKYFGDQVNIVGIDIDQRSMFREDQITTLCGDQSDPGFLNYVAQLHGPFDVIIDDGSHIQRDVMQSFGHLYHTLNNNGVYVIEDCHTAYRKEYLGGVTSPFNIFTLLSRAVHDVNLQWMSEPFTPTLNDLKSLCFYDSMAVIEKQVHLKRQPIFSGVKKVINE